MTPTTAVNALSALAQETRLSVFRLLVAVGQSGLAAGEISTQLGLPANTLSFHLKALSQANLIEARQQGRFIFYTANFVTMDDLIVYLTDNCCQGEGQCLPRTAAVSSQTVKPRRQAA